MTSHCVLSSYSIVYTDILLSAVNVMDKQQHVTYCIIQQSDYLSKGQRVSKKYCVFVYCILADVQYKENGLNFYNLHSFVCVGQFTISSVLGVC